MNNEIIVVGVDTGNKNIKTPHTQPFNSGLIRHGRQAPAIAVDTLLYNSMYYSLTESRIPAMFDKTETDDFFLLSLFAIARELEALYPGEDIYSGSICLALGLPPAHLQTLKSKYISYFSENGSRIRFLYDSKPFDLAVAKVEVFPQGYAAVVPYLAEINTKPRCFVIDIGGYTTDVVMLQNGRPDMSFCESLNEGVLRMFDQVKRALRNRFQMDVDDYMVDSILRGQTEIDPEAKRVASNTAVQYAEKLIHSLEEMGVDLRVSYPVFIGGGSVLMKSIIMHELHCKEYKFIEDVRANAIGYALLANGRLAQNR